jgi:uncharacterized protein YcaQ
MGARTRVDSYRGRKDSALALYYLWRTGEAMVTRRERFERVYAASEIVASRRYLVEAPEAEADERLLLKDVAAAGFSRLNLATYTIHREITAKELATWRDRKLADGELVEVEIEGYRQPHVAVASEVPALEAIAAGRTPRAWKPLDATTTDETTFLSPLDPVIADRERTRRLLDFDYRWEVYSKVELRTFGYYVLPILWGDRLVGRFDSKLDRPTMTLVVNGMWLEDEALATNDAFIEALARGMNRFLEFLDARHIDVRAVPQAAIRRRLTPTTGAKATRSTRHAASAR